MNNEPSKCDCCGNSDRPTTVRCCSFGAFSMAYCDVCEPMYAELKTFAEYFKGPRGSHCCTYDPDSDKYYLGLSGKHQPIELKDGTVFDTRSEFVDWARKKEGLNP